MKVYVHIYGVITIHTLISVHNASNYLLSIALWLRCIQIFTCVEYSATNKKTNADQKHLNTLQLIKDQCW